MMEAVSTCETLTYFCQTTQRNIPEDSHILKQRLFYKSTLERGFNEYFSK
jgi:hypothetical protein